MDQSQVLNIGKATDVTNVQDTTITTSIHSLQQQVQSDTNESITSIRKTTTKQQYNNNPIIQLLNDAKIAKEPINLIIETVLAKNDKHRDKPD